MFTKPATVASFIMVGYPIGIVAAAEHSQKDPGADVVLCEARDHVILIKTLLQRVGSIRISDTLRSVMVGSFWQQTQSTLIPAVLISRDQFFKIQRIGGLCLGVGLHIAGRIIAVVMHPPRRAPRATPELDVRVDGLRHLD